MDVMERIQGRMELLVKNNAEGHEASAKMDFRVIFHPVFNAKEPTALAVGVCDELGGGDQVLSLITISEPTRPD